MFKKFLVSIIICSLLFFSLNSESVKVVINESINIAIEKSFETLDTLLEFINLTSEVTVIDDLINDLKDSIEDGLKDALTI